VLLPGLSASSSCVVELVTFSETARLLASGRKAARFAMLK
jgi:hypothetical protein